jgi:hydrophobe/amphiphile efflux-1 (HAE1) family protein
MRLSHFFIDRPIFAAVVSIVFVIVGAVSVGRLPIAQYPEIAPPVVRVSGQYPGASADIVAATVAAPLEQEINGVENMIYIASNSTGDGRFQIDVTFDLGTNLDTAQVQVQNRVAVALPRIPADVRNIGVTTIKSSPDLMMVVHLYSPDKSRDTLFISNYAKTEVTDVLGRIYGIGSVTAFGARDYSMRVWLDPNRLQSLGLTAGDVLAGLQGQNVQVAAGVLNQPPVEQPRAFQLAVRTLGRLIDPNEFANVVIKQSATAVVRLKDVGRVELAAVDYSTNSYLDRDPAVALAIFQLPGSNALATAGKIKSTMEELSKDFPDGLKYTIIYNPTEFVQQSIDAVVETIVEAVILVVLVVLLFLQTWRAAIIPIVAIPVSLVGTFFVMAMFGFSLNNLSLFGLVLAIGIVVDDAIVVVENVERNIAAGLSPREAARKSMDEVGTALIAIALVLCAVFVPAGFITGISGQFYRQFALTIAGATVISLIVSLTLSPAMCALLLKPHAAGARDRWWLRPVNGFFRGFNAGFDALGRGYGWLAARVVRFAVLMLVVYAGVIAFGLNEFRKAPVGFIPQVDQGYLIVVTQLPGGASLARTDEVNRRAVEAALQVPGITHAANFVGFSGATFTNAPNAGAIFVTLEPFAERAKDPRKSAPAIQAALMQKLSAIEEGFVLVIAPPAVRGIGTSGGFRMMVEDRAGRGPEALQAAVFAMMGRAAQTPGVTQVFSLFESSTPQLYLDIDRTKAQMLGVNLPDVFGALQTDLGSFYVNDFNLLGRTFRVTVQAESSYRLDPKDVLQIRVRNSSGDTVPLGSFVTVRDTTGPYRVPRYNLYPAAELDGAPAPGASQGQAIETMARPSSSSVPATPRSLPSCWRWCSCSWCWRPSTRA